MSFDSKNKKPHTRTLSLSEIEKCTVSKDKNKKENFNDAEPEETLWLKLLLSGMINEETLKVISDDQIYQVKETEQKDKKILIIPGFYGVAADIYKDLVKGLIYSSYILQLYETLDCVQLCEKIITYRIILNKLRHLCSTSGLNFNPGLKLNNSFIMFIRLLSIVLFWAIRGFNC